MGDSLTHASPTAGPLPGSTLYTGPSDAIPASPSRTVTSAEFESRLSRVETAFQAQLKSISATLGVDSGRAEVPGAEVGGEEEKVVEVSRSSKTDLSSKAGISSKADISFKAGISSKVEVPSKVNSTELDRVVPKPDPVVARRLDELEARALRAEAAAAS